MDIRAVPDWLIISVPNWQVYESAHWNYYYYKNLVYWMVRLTVVGSGIIPVMGFYGDGTVHQWLIDFKLFKSRDLRNVR